MKKIVLFCFLAALSFQANSQVVATRIRDLTAETTLYTDTYFVVDRVGYAVLKKTSMATVVAYLNTLYAPIYSPNFTGTPTTTVPISTDNSNRIPTTSWVKSLLGTIGSDSSKVKVLSEDPIADYLYYKIIARTGITTGVVSSSGLHGNGLSIANTMTHLGDLLDVNTTGPINRTPLVWDATDSTWKPLNQIGGGIPRVLEDLENVDAARRGDDQILRYNSSTMTWQPVSLVVTDTVAPNAVSIHHSLVRADFVGQMFINTRDTTHVYFSLDKSGKWCKFNISY